MNLYATPRSKATMRPVNSHTVYLALLTKESPEISTDFKIITTIRWEDKKLFVLSNAGMFYLSDNYILGEGMANILYSSTKVKRVIDYGNIYIKQ